MKNDLTSEENSSQLQKKLCWIECQLCWVLFISSCVRYVIFWGDLKQSFIKGTKMFPQISVEIIKKIQN